MKLIPKPLEGEYAPYTIMYIGLLPDDRRVLDHLQENLQVMLDFIRSFPVEQLTYRWANREWTIKEILVHVSDDERIYAYRALRFARGDTTELPGFEQDEYVPYSKANERDIEDILAEYITVRQATLTLFKSFDSDALKRAGVANGHLMSVRAAAYHIAGHELHHLNSMRENYGAG
ncbi:MAG: DinB family protein [Anaerolineaceae bacterium]|nr:DinB family protein [Anaerolineaceae bacterium]